MAKGPTMGSLPPTGSLQRMGFFAFFAILLTLWFASAYFIGDPYLSANIHRPPRHASATLLRCRALGMQAGPHTDFHRRSESDRFVQGTKPVLIQRAKIWTGRKNGTEVIHGDILIDKGLFKSVGSASRGVLSALGSDLVVVDAKDSWITPGIVDIHSHLGDGSSPALDGAEDDNSLKGTAQPWLRSLDGLNTHDDSYPLSIAGGVTTSLVLPGSANAIGKLPSRCVALISSILQVVRLL